MGGCAFGFEETAHDTRHEADSAERIQLRVELLSLRLRVSPIVAGDGSIQMSVEIQNEVPTGTAVGGGGASIPHCNPYPSRPARNRAPTGR